MGQDRRLDTDRRIDKDRRFGKNVGYNGLKEEAPPIEEVLTKEDI